MQGVHGGLMTVFFITMLRGDPVRGAGGYAGRRMDDALRIIGVFLLEPYNPGIV